MAVNKFQSTDGFVVVDFPGAPSAGSIRRAKKILESGAVDLARSASYTFASFEIERGGASGGLNAEGDAIGPAVEAMVAELEPLAVAGELHLYPAKGLTAEQFAPLERAAGLNPLAGSEHALIAGIITAASWAAGGSLDGKSVAIEQTKASPAPPGLAAAVQAAGGQIVDVPDLDAKPWMIWGADADIIMAGSKAGVLNHQGAEFVKAAALVPWGPIPFTTKAIATLLRVGKSKVVPDFISASGGLVAGYIPGDEDAVLRQIVSSVAALLTEVGTHQDGPLLAACYRAESFITSWQGKPPFGRPMAA